MRLRSIALVLVVTFCTLTGLVSCTAGAASATPSPAKASARSLKAIGVPIATTSSRPQASAQSGCSATGVGLPTSAYGYWLAGADGSVYSCGDAPWHGSLPSLGISPDGPVVGMAGCNGGYLLTTSAGAVYVFGGIPFDGGADSLPLTGPIVGVAMTSDCDGYWLVSANGGVFTFGDADFLGSAGDLQLNQPMVGMAAPSEPLTGCRVAEWFCDSAYWLVAADGGVFSYSITGEGWWGSSANFLGSTGCLTLNKPVVGMVASPDTTDAGGNTACHSGPLASGGYWMVASDGGVFAFGNAPFFGSTGCLTLNKPIVGMVASSNNSAGWGSACLPQDVPGGSYRPALGGYAMVASDGGVFTFGNAPFTGSLPGSGISVNDVVGMALYTAS